MKKNPSSTTCLLHWPLISNFTYGPLQCLGSIDVSFVFGFCCTLHYSDGVGIGGWWGETFSFGRSVWDFNFYTVTTLKSSKRESQKIQKQGSHHPYYFRIFPLFSLTLGNKTLAPLHTPHLATDTLSFPASLLYLFICQLS